MPKSAADRLSDPLTEAFVFSDREIFRSVAYPTEVWKEDPCDVETIHAAARDQFDRLLTQAVDPDSTNNVGRMWLLLGEAGAGKTHLMRAFRTRTHSGGAGYFGYMQMTSSATNYGRYVLRMLIESLQKPYSPRLMDDYPRGLRRLSNVLAERKGGDPQLLKRLRTEDLTPDVQNSIIIEMQKQVIRSMPETSTDLIRVLLFLQTEDAHAHDLAMKYLRAESLSAADQEYLAGVTPLDGEEDAIEMILSLGHLMWNLQKAALVICVDQIEDMMFEIEFSKETRDRFLRALNTLRAVAERLPSGIVIVSCLEEFYRAFADNMPGPLKDRLITNPVPIALVAERSRGEVDDMVSAHLQQLIDDDSDFDLEGTAPIPEQVLKAATGLPSRQVLDACRNYREQCLSAGYLVAPDTVDDQVSRDENSDPQATRQEAEWNDFLAQWEWTLPDADAELIALLDRTIQQVPSEHERRFQFETQFQDGYLTIVSEWHGFRRQVGICNKSSRGGGLTKQVSTLRESAEQQMAETAPVIVRMTDYRPKSPTAKISNEYAAVAQVGGFPVTIDESDWRRMAAYKAFTSQSNGSPGFAEWVKTLKPMTRVASLQTLLSLDQIGGRSTEPSDPEANTQFQSEKPGPQTKTVQPSISPQQDAPPLTTSGKIRIGTDERDTTVDVDPEAFKRHAAFLGGTGSGKTTAALNIVEQLLLDGIPVLLIDRKGDLATFADKAIWNRETDDAQLNARGKQLQQSIDVALYTPGHKDGRPLSLSIVPPNIEQVPEGERQIICRNAADALARIIGYGSSKTARSCTSALIKAIEVMADRKEEITLESLIRATYDPDAELIAALGILDPKVFEKVAEDLQMLGINQERLFPKNCPALNAEAFFANQSSRTPLSIISTKFLGGEDGVEFWIAQLLFELNRWCSRSPSADLQAVVMFDEADLYLPATKKPATKEPMEGLLKRARSAGLGVFLGTQSPGDFDYKCRDNIHTWMVGNIKEKRAIDKLKSVFSGSRVDVSKRLPKQQTGEFHLCHGSQVRSVRSDQSYMETKQLSEEEILRLARDGRK